LIVAAEKSCPIVADEARDKQGTWPDPGEAPEERKLWIETRLEELAEIFGRSVGGFKILDNDLHLLVRLDPRRSRTGRTKR
jgi:hypothetical protein